MPVKKKIQCVFTPSGWRGDFLDGTFWHCYPKQTRFVFHSLLKTFVVISSWNVWEHLLSDNTAEFIQVFVCSDLVSLLFWYLILVQKTTSVWRLLWLWWYMRFAGGTDIGTLPSDNVPIYTYDLTWTNYFRKWKGLDTFLQSAILLQLRSCVRNTGVMWWINSHTRKGGQVSSVNITVCYLFTLPWVYV